MVNQKTETQLDTITAAIAAARSAMAAGKAEAAEKLMADAQQEAENASARLHHEDEMSAALCSIMRDAIVGAA